MGENPKSPLVLACDLAEELAANKDVGYMEFKERAIGLLEEALTHQQDSSLSAHRADLLDNASKVYDYISDGSATRWATPPEVLIDILRAERDEKKRLCDALKRIDAYIERQGHDGTDPGWVREIVYRALKDGSVEADV